MPYFSTGFSSPSSSSSSSGSGCHCAFCVSFLGETGQGILKISSILSESVDSASCFLASSSHLIISLYNESSNELIDETSFVKSITSGSIVKSIISGSSRVRVRFKIGDSISMSEIDKSSRSLFFGLSGVLGVLGNLGDDTGVVTKPNILSSSSFSIRSLSMFLSVLVLVLVLVESISLLRPLLFSK